MGGGETLRQPQMVAEREFRAQGRKQGGGECHDPQPAELNQDQNNYLPEQGIISAGVNHGQTGNADRRGGGKQGVDYSNRAGRTA